MTPLVRFFFFVGIFFARPCFAQLETGLFTGVSNYQGDISSVSTADGLRIKLGPVFGVQVDYALTPGFHARLQALYTRLSGDDALAAKLDSRRRNLDFFAPLGQISFGLEWYPFAWRPEQQHRLSPYLVACGAGFYFNPRTVFEGRKISLQPLGTEGQYLSAYPEQRPYRRFQPGLIVGGGFKMAVKKSMRLAIEGMLTYTFTDYLDDASTIYIDYYELLQEAGPLTAALANRQGEYLGTGPVITPTGTFRANPSTRDLFGMVTFRIAVPVDVAKDRPAVRYHHHRKMRCPRF